MKLLYLVLTIIWHTSTARGMENNDNNIQNATTHSQNSSVSGRQVTTYDVISTGAQLFNTTSELICQTLGPYAQSPDIHRPKEQQTILERMWRGYLGKTDSELSNQKLGRVNRNKLSDKGYVDAYNSEWQYTQKLYNDIQQLSLQPIKSIPTLNIDDFNALKNRSSLIIDSASHLMKELQISQEHERPLLDIKQLLKNYPAAPLWIIQALLNAGMEKESALLSIGNNYSASRKSIYPHCSTQQITLLTQAHHQLTALQKTLAALDSTKAIQYAAINYNLDSEEPSAPYQDNDQNSLEEYDSYDQHQKY